MHGHAPSDVPLQPFKGRPLPSQVLQSEWKTQGSVNRYMRLPDGKPPLTCREEILGVVGYGGLGQSDPQWGHEAVG